MAYSLNFNNSSKTIEFGNLLGVPDFKYEKFIGIKNQKIFDIDQSFRKFDYGVGIKGEAFLTAGLDLKANASLGGIKIDFPWKDLGALSIKLNEAEKSLEISNTLDLNKFQLKKPTVTLPNVSLYAGFEGGLGGKLGGFVNNRNFTLVDIDPAQFSFKYPIIDWKSGASNNTSPPPEASAGGFKASIDFPDVNKLNNLFNPTVLTSGLQLPSGNKLPSGISVGGEVPIFTLEASLIQLAGNFFPPIKALAGSYSLGIADIDYTLIDGQLRGGINLGYNANINFGNIVANLTFEDKSKFEIDLTTSKLPKILLGNDILTKLDPNKDGRADIRFELGFKSPQIQASAGLYADIYANLVVGKANVSIDAGFTKFSKSLGPLFEQRFDIAKFPLIEAKKNFDLPPDLAPTIGFNIPLSLETLKAGGAPVSLAAQPDNVPVLKTILEKEGNTFLAQKGNQYVAYRQEQLRASEDSINPYNSLDLIAKALPLRESNNGLVISENNLFKGKYRPLGVERNNTGEYTVVFRQDGFAPFKNYSPSDPPFSVWRASEKTIEGQKYLVGNQFTSVTTNQAGLYERLINQDINLTNFLEHGELIDGYILGRGLWRNQQGQYWLGHVSSNPPDPQRFPGVDFFLSDPSSTSNSFPGTPIAYIPKSENIASSQYEAVLLKEGENIFLWNVDSNNRRVGDAVELDAFQVGHFERSRKKDLNLDRVIGTNLIIDSDINKDEYTILSAIYTNDKPNGTYAIAHNQLKEGNTADRRVIALKDDLRQDLGPGLSSVTNAVGKDWTAIAAALHQDESHVDVMWKSPKGTAPRWFIWRFDVEEQTARPTVEAGFNLAEYLNSPQEVIPWEGRFSEDFNQDGFIGKVTTTENLGNTSIITVDARFLGQDPFDTRKSFRYQIREKDQAQGKDLHDPFFGPSGLVTPSSSWQPIAAETILVDIPESINSNESKRARYYVLGKTSNAYSLWLVNSNAGKISERTIAAADLGAYESVFLQDLDNDGKINKIDKILDVSGKTSLLEAKTGYIIEDSGNRLTLKGTDGKPLKNFSGDPQGINKTVSGFELISFKQKNAQFELVTLNAQGAIQTITPLATSEIPRYEGIFAQKLFLTFSGNNNNDLLNGTNFNDTIKAKKGNDTLKGGLGDDALDGGSGNDLLLGEGGNDELKGDDDNDTLIGGAGNDTLQGEKGTDLLNGEADADILDGGQDNDTLIGGSGNDTLIGGSGNDSLVGGAGDDSYYVDSSSDTITENVNEGTDSVEATVNYFLPANIEKLVFKGNNGLNGTGNNLNNTLVGNNGSNTLTGGAGADTLTGGAGVDTFVVAFGHSLLTSSDRFTDFTINSDKIDLLTQAGAVLPAPAKLTRAANTTQTNLTNVVNQVFRDADGAIAGQQSLGVNSAALVQIGSGQTTAMYLIINDSSVGLQANTDILLNLTGITGNLPALGNILVNSFFA